MAVLAPLPPEELKTFFVESGFAIVAEDEYNWLMASGAKDEPFALPKKGRLVSVEIMDLASEKARLHGLVQQLHTRGRGRYRLRSRVST